MKKLLGSLVVLAVAGLFGCSDCRTEKTHEAEAERANQVMENGAVKEQGDKVILAGDRAMEAGDRVIVAGDQTIVAGDRAVVAGENAVQAEENAVEGAADALKAIERGPK